MDAVKTEEKLLNGSELEGPCPKKRRKHYEYSRLDAWKSVFGIYILDNPKIQIPTHPDAIKLKKQFRVPYSILTVILEMFSSRDRWNPASADCLWVPVLHSLKIKILSSLFILGRGVDLDTVSMLAGISIGTLISFFHHYFV